MNKIIGKLNSIIEIILFLFIFPVGWVLMKLRVTRLKRMNTTKELFYDYCDLVKVEWNGTYKRGNFKW